MAGLLSVFLEELTDFAPKNFCFEVNTLQFEALRDLLLEMINDVAKGQDGNWTYHFQGKNYYHQNI